MILNTEGTKPDGGVVAALSNDNQAYIYAKQMSGLAQIFVMNSSGAAGGGGTETQISPHNSNGDWCFNEYDGGQRRRRYINMIAVIEKLEALTGETFIHDTFDVDQDWVPVDY
jgi:hypothetical protein